MIFLFTFQIHSFTEVVQRVQISNVDLDTHTEVLENTRYVSTPFSYKQDSPSLQAWRLSFLIN